MSPETVELERTAIDACLAGGRYLREAFRSEQTTARHLDHDVKSSADTGSEERVLGIIQSRFPGHHVVAEESGRHEGDDRYRWIVDPLDGTNDFEAGLPTFATAVAVLVDGAPEVGVVYVPVPDDLYVGRAGEGVRYNGRPVEATSSRPPARATVVSVIGHDVKQVPEHSEVSERLNRAVETRCKRRVESWSPTVHWGLLARGRMDGIVCYRPDEDEQHLGELFAAESGLDSESGDHWFVAATTTELRSSLAALAREHTPSQG
ncbi:MAG: inositol monophosphatase family protein [Halovenus sp.]